MTTATITQSPSATNNRSTWALIGAAVVLVAAIALIVALLVSGVFSSTVNSKTGGSGADTSYCRSTTVVHYC